MLHNCLVYASSIQRSDLASAGFAFNEDKSNMEVFRQGEWLRFVVDTIQHVFRISLAKLTNLKSSLRTVLGVLHYSDKYNQIAVIHVILLHSFSEKTTKKKYFLQCSLYFNFRNHLKQSMNESDNVNVLPTILSNLLPTMLP